MELSQQLKLQQNLSPQMLQSLVLLPMPIQELRAMILKEIEENPALKIPESDLLEVPSELTDYSDSDASDRKQNFLENVAVTESLSEHLLSQLGSCPTTKEVEEISNMLIGNLDSNGFFLVSIETLFENTSYSQDDIKTALALVQSFEPYGICVADFRQSLILQAKCSGMTENDLEIFTKLVNEHLENIKNGKTKEVSQALRIPQEDVLVFFSILKSFNPFPGRLYSSNTQAYVVPEFSVHNINGELVMTLTNGELPDLKISKDFEELSKKKLGKDENAYISASLQQAKNLINQVQLRYQTLSKAALCLVEKQQDFFFDGPKSLKVLTLKEVADEILVHETTMSRLTQNKYVETDFGIFPMKYFFSQGVSTDSGENISRNAVKDMIAEIKNTNPKISAQKISDMLAEKGISCARRTVSKYLSEL